MTEMPPTRPSDEDRAQLRARVCALLEARGKSQRWLEKKMGRPAATLTKLFAGRLRFSRAHIDEMAKALGVEAAALVEGTWFVALLSPPVVVDPQEAEPLARAIEELKVQLAAKDALLAAKQAELDEVTARARTATQAQERTMTELARTQAEREAERKATDDLRRTLKARTGMLQMANAICTTERRAKENAEARVRQMQSSLSVSSATTAEIAQQRDAWRNCALQHMAEVHRLRQELAGQTSIGATIATGLAAFAVGALVANAAAPDAE